jgi:mannose-1-phosphate guanylyltransferase
MKLGASGQPLSDLSQVRTVVMAGGASSRFWPVNKILAFLADQSRSMIKLARDRVVRNEPKGEFPKFVDENNFFIVTGADNAALIQRNLGLASENMLIEPGRRNTLPAILWTMANLCAREIMDPTLVILTGDHLMPEVDRFRTTLDKAAAAAQKTAAIVTIGIQPSRDTSRWTSFGMINVGKAEKISGVEGLDRILKFEEKPNEARAKAMQAEGEGKWLWNAGMFVFRVSVMEKVLEKIQPEMYTQYQAMVKALRQNQAEEAKVAFLDLPLKIKHPETTKYVDNSIDFAVMMPLTSQNIQAAGIQGLVVPGNFQWIDIGNWDEIECLAQAGLVPKDRNGNIVLGQGRVNLNNVKNSVIYTGEDVTLNLENVDAMVFAAESNGNMLVTVKGKAKDIKEVSEPIIKGQVAAGIKIFKDEAGASVPTENLGPGIVVYYGIEAGTVADVSVSEDGKTMTLRAPMDKLRNLR